VYNIRRAARFLRARGKSIPPFPDFHVLPVHTELELDMLPSLPTSTQEMELYRPGDPVPESGPPAGIDDDQRDTSTWARTEPDDDLIPVEVIPPAGHGDELDDLSLHAQLDDEPARSEPLDGATGRERRTYIRTLADPAGSDSERHALLGRIAIRKVAVGSAPRVMAGATLGEATRAIRRSTGRDRVADLVIDTLDRFAPACEAAIMLVMRGATAIGWKGFVRGGGALGEIAVPMENGGLVPRAVELNVTLRTPWAELAAIDRLLLASLGRHSGDLVIVPISIADQVMCVIAIATGENAPLSSAEPIAAAAGAAFARLMRDASR
jgi:hypothetical protein